jgi:hypothetical protein
MALTTYADLTAAVRDWLARTADTTFLTNARVEDAITLAEVDIYERLRVREMEASADLTITGQTVALPSGFIGARRLYLVADPLVEVQYMAPPHFWGRFAAVQTGRPFAYTIEGENIVLGPAPDANYTGKLLHWKRLAALSSGVNALFQRQPDLWLYGALAHAALFVKETDEAPIWQGRFEAAIARAERSNERERVGSAPLVVRVG